MNAEAVRIAHLLPLQTKLYFEKLPSLMWQREEIERLHSDKDLAE